MNPHVIWSSTVDNGAWEVKVVRHGDTGHVGILCVTNLATGHIIHTQTVSVAYGALFGPDVSDVAGWQLLAIDIIDKPSQGNPLGSPKRYLVQREEEGQWPLIAMYDNLSDAQIRRGEATTSGSDVRVWDNTDGVEV